MKIVCIYHSQDLDGWMSAAIIKHWFIRSGTYVKDNSKSLSNTISVEAKNTIFEEIPNGDSLTFIGYSYGQPVPGLSEYDKVIMCDISFSKEEMSNIRGKKGNNFIWIDHHISAINDAKEIFKEYYESFNGLRDTKFAACELTWKYFFPNSPMPEIVRLLGRYDCFGHKGTDEEKKVLEFQYGARCFISNYEEAYKYLQMYFDREKNEDESNELINSISTIGAGIYQYLYTEAKQIYDKGIPIKFLVDSIPTNEEIRPIPAIGYCYICGKLENKQLIRHYFRYENDKCDCHSPYHFDLFDCCQECKPVARNRVPKKFICINRERFNPINFGIDYHKDGYDGCACFWYNDGMWHFSLYNDNGLVDCSVIAKQYGGGGHAGASGFRIKDLTRIIK